jgi:mono/diheme cytochrome c family protein
MRGLYRQCLKVFTCSALGLVVCGQSKAQPSPAATKGAAAPRALFKQYCAKCHGTDGTGSRMRDLQPAIPDFTAAAFQSGHSDVQLLVSIRDRKGTDMPAFGGRFDSVAEHGLVKHVRSFAPASGDARDRRDQDDTVVLTGKPPDEPRPPEGMRLSGNSLEKPIEWLGRFHVAAVHFPIALLLAAGVAEMLRDPGG